MASFKRYVAVLAFLSWVIISCNKGSDSSVIKEKGYEEFTTEVVGLSGICFSNDKASLFAVSDKYGIFELNTDGSTKRKFSYNGANDFEAITADPVTGNIYLADEGQMNLLLLSANEQSVSLVTHITINGGVSNKGIEGLAYGRDTLYAVNQQSPTLLIKYSLGSHMEATRTVLSFATYLSDIFFDASDNSLWICDSYQKKIFHCNCNGGLIASQDIDFVAKAEGIVVDRTANVAWIGCDQTGKLYRIKLTI